MLLSEKNFKREMKGRRGLKKKREEFRASIESNLCTSLASCERTDERTRIEGRGWIAGGGRGGWCRFRTCKGEARAIVRSDWNHANLYLTCQDFESVDIFTVPRCHLYRALSFAPLMLQTFLLKGWVSNGSFSTDRVYSNV